MSCVSIYPTTKMKSVLQFFLLSTLVLAATSCSCLPQTFRQHLQNGDHLLKVKVVHEIVPPGGWHKYYLAKVSAVWKTSNPHVRCDRWVVLRTAKHSATYGVTLQVGATYLLNGGGTQSVGPVGIIDINFCGLVRQYCTLFDCELKQLSVCFHCDGPKLSRVGGFRSEGLVYLRW